MEEISVAGSLEGSFVFDGINYDSGQLNLDYLESVKDHGREFGIYKIILWLHDKNGKNWGVIPYRRDVLSNQAEKLHGELLGAVKEKLPEIKCHEDFNDVIDSFLFNRHHGEGD